MKSFPVKFNKFTIILCEKEIRKTNSTFYYMEYGIYNTSNTDMSIVVKIYYFYKKSVSNAKIHYNNSIIGEYRTVEADYQNKIYSTY